MTKYIRNDAELLKVVAPLAYGFGDKTFKFVSWLIVIAAIRYAQASTGSTILWWLSAFLVTVYVGTLFLVLSEMSMRGFPDTPYVPGFLRWFIAGTLFCLGFGMAISIMIPTPSGLHIVDQILAELQGLQSSKR